MLVAGAMLELDVRELLGDLERLIHVAVGGGEDQFVALLGEVFQDRDCARILFHVLDIGRDDLALERGVERKSSLVVSPGPAEIADRAKIDVADLQRLRGEGASPEGGQSQAGGGGLDEIAPCDCAHFLLLE